MFNQLISITLATGCLAVLAKPGLPDSSRMKDAFNAAKGKVRVVMLVSPSCPACVSGADAIRDDVVGKVKDTRLATFAVYIPMIEGDDKTQATESAKKMAGAEIASFWDGSRSLGKAYARTVPLPSGNTIAWDVYFVYGPKAVWHNSPPKPDFWMHQLDCGARCLDPAKFRVAVQNELKTLK